MGQGTAPPTGSELCGPRKRHGKARLSRPGSSKGQHWLPERSGQNLLQILFPVGSEGPRLLSHVPSTPCARLGESGPQSASRAARFLKPPLLQGPLARLCA